MSRAAVPLGGVRVHVASILHEYTGGTSTLRAHGLTPRELLNDLDARHRGLLFRIVDEQGRLRPHVKIYVDGRLERDLDAPLGTASDVHVLQALSGG